MIKKIKEILDSALGDNQSEQKIIPIDSQLLQELANEMAPKEPDLRTIGIFTDVESEKIAELVHALLYLNETNKMEPDPEKHLPIDFYISTYGGSADGGSHGSLPNLANEMEAMQQIQKDYIEVLVSETSMTKKQLKNMLERKVNVYLSAEEAVELGIADEII